MNYNPQQIEKKWQEIWEKKKFYQVDLKSAKKPFYNLMMFPYPSAEGLHVGNMYAFVHSDTYGRFMRLKGFDVFEPIGLDGFGIHSENYAIKVGEHISEVSKRTEKHFYEQLHMIGNQFDWSQALETYKPEYYKWTQWIFVQMFKRGLAYQAESYVNWCPSCKTVLSDEQVISGQCERCDTVVEKKLMKQWFFRITDYAERLLKNLEWINWSERTKLSQRNWIGKSEGANIRFQIKDARFQIEVFTTRLDTIFGCTYCVLAPEHKLIQELKPQIKNWEEVEKYIAQARKKSEMERTELAKEKTGVELKGVKAINPFNNQEIPVFSADYVLVHYGTGAVMAVPGHDERDYEFAKKYDLPIVEVIKSKDGKSLITRVAAKGEEEDLSSSPEEEAFVEDGVLINSGEYNGLSSENARQKLADWLEKNSLGTKKVHYKLRDWCVSRQRYWGPPIPIIYCDACRERKYRYLLLHGKHGSSQKDFFPWLKKELENLGHEVYCLDLPNTEDPRIEEQADFVIKNFKLDSNTIIVGHSLGGAVALNILEKTNKKVAKVVFVDSLMSPKFSDKRRPDLEKSFHWKFNFEKIKKLSFEFVDLADCNFPIIPKEQFEEKNRLLDTRLVYVKPQHNHFDSAKEPIILEYSVINGVFSVPEKDLPVLLPETKDYLPKADGLAPLARNDKFWKIKCPRCGGPARRETDVSDTFLDSSWYFFRYPSTELKDKIFDKERTKKWLPVDMYIGGQEHAVLHLLYSRFMTMFFKDLGLIDFEEPYKRFFAHGLLIREGAKMSKSKGNIVNPDEYIEKYGADAVRMYLMFLGDVSQGGDWRDSGMNGMFRFMNRIWKLSSQTPGKNQGLKNLVHKTIKKVTDDLEGLKFNIAISALMILVNGFEKEKEIDREDFETFLKLLSPFAPHIAEELWSQFDHKDSIFKEKWSEYDPKLVKEKMITLIIQVNGKVRDKIEVEADISEEKAKELAFSSEKIKKWTDGKEPKKVIFVENKLINIVV